MAYKTIFEQIKEDAGGKSQSKDWYRKELSEKSPRNLIIDERSDEIGDELERDRNLSKIGRAHV